MVEIFKKNLRNFYVAVNFMELPDIVFLRKHLCNTRALINSKLASVGRLKCQLNTVYKFIKG